MSIKNIKKHGRYTNDTAGREHQEYQETDQGILKIQLVESI